MSAKDVVATLKYWCDGGFCDGEPHDGPCHKLVPVQWHPDGRVKRMRFVPKQLDPDPVKHAAIMMAYFRGEG